MTERTMMRGAATAPPRQRRHLVAIAVAAIAIGAPQLAAALATGMIDSYVGGGVGDGAAASQAIVDPHGLAAVVSGGAAHLYIADGKQHRVRRIDGNTGLIQTVAGNGESGFSGDGGAAQDASLVLPLDVALDAAGNLYISDYTSNRIRKVTPSGQISTFAGNGDLSDSGDGGLATRAAFHNPWGIAVGPDGYVYIADSGNNRIRKVGPPGCAPQNCVITTAVGNGSWGFAGDGGPAPLATLRNPSDIAFDAAGNMVIADWGNQRVRRVANGLITTVAGGGSIGTAGNVGDGGPAVGGVLRYPAQVAVDSAGVIYVTDTQQRRVRKVQNGIITTLAGTGVADDGGDGGLAVKAPIQLPYGVAVHPDGGVWLASSTDVATSQHNRVRLVTALGIILPVAGGSSTQGVAAVDALIDPRGAAAVPGDGPVPDLYFADGINHSVRVVDGANGNVYIVAGTGMAGYSGDGGPAINADLDTPLDVAVDRNGNVFVADTSNDAVRRIDTKGVITTVAGTGYRGFAGDNGPGTQAQLASPNGVAVDAAGNLFIADYNNNRVRKVGLNGIITTVAGNGTSGYGGDGGPATSASLRNPWDIAVTGNGTLYIADTFNQRIRRVDPSGIITTYAGIGYAGFSGDGGVATAARLDTPSLLSLDNGGRLYIADRNNRRVRAIDPKTHVITTVAGNGETGVSGDGGPAVLASFSTPSGVAIDPSGKALFVGANDDARVRVATLGGGCAIVGPPQHSDAALAFWLVIPAALLFRRRRERP